MCCVRELERMLDRRYEVVWRDDEFIIYESGIRIASITDETINIEIYDPVFVNRMRWISTLYGFEIKNLK